MVDQPMAQQRGNAATAIPVSEDDLGLVQRPSAADCTDQGVRRLGRGETVTHKRSSPRVHNPNAATAGYGRGRIQQACKALYAAVCRPFTRVEAQAWCESNHQQNVDRALRTSGARIVQRGTGNKCHLWEYVD